MTKGDCMLKNTFYRDNVHIVIEHPLIKEIYYNSNCKEIKIFCNEDCGQKVFDKIEKTKREFRDKDCKLVRIRQGYFSFKYDFQAFEKAAHILNIEQKTINDVAKMSGNEKVLFLKGTDIIAPSIYVNTQIPVVPKNQTTREFVEQYIKKNKHSWTIATKNMVEIRNMGIVGDGLFAKEDIPKDTVFIFGGIVVPRAVSYFRHKNGCPMIYEYNCSSSNKYIEQMILIGTGECAADKMQHAYPFQTLKEQGIKLNDKVAEPNVKDIAIKTEGKFFIPILVTDKLVKKNQILLKNYGLAPFNKYSNMNVMALFDSNGNIIQKVKIDKKEQKLQPITEKVNKGKVTRENIFLRNGL